MKFLDKRRGMESKKENRRARKEVVEGKEYEETIRGDDDARCFRKETTLHTATTEAARSHNTSATSDAPCPPPPPSRDPT